jgi:3-hydroxyacyl-CoA dehydrogenase
MGSGIAASFATAGFDVLMVEQDAAALEKGIARTGAAIESIGRRSALPAETVAAARARVRGVADLSALAPAELVVEAIVEDMDAKRSVFAALDRVLGPEAILCSNTSYLDIDAMAAATARPASCAGMHFFSPAHVMRLVEVVRAAATAPDVIATLVGLGRRLGKVPVVTGASEGFVGNRILAAYRQQCDFLLEEGAYPYEVDAALQDFGMAMGPYAVSDLAGLDIAWRMRKRRAATRDPQARYFPAADRLCEMGRFGRKSGAGWYRYGEGKGPERDPDVEALIARLSGAAGVTRRPIAADAICARVMAAIVNEACLILAEGTAERPADIDLVMVNGYGFPASKGGPLFWASRRPRAEFLAEVDRMLAASGVGVARAPGIADVLDSVDG